MLKSFREIAEASVNVPLKKTGTMKPKARTSHYKSHVREPHVPHALRTGPTGQFDRPMKEEAPAMAVGGAGDPGKVTDATANYAAQLKKRLQTKIMKRKEPK